jgi:hypothetical protein
MLQTSKKCVITFLMVRRLLNYADLQPVIFREHRESLESWASNHYACILCHWLGMDDQGGGVVVLGYNSKPGKTPEAGAAVNAANASNQDNEEELPDKLIVEHDMEEAARIQQERQIEGEDSGTVRFRWWSAEKTPWWTEN